MTDVHIATTLTNTFSQTQMIGSHATHHSLWSKFGSQNLHSENLYLWYEKTNLNLKNDNIVEQNDKSFLLIRGSRRLLKVGLEGSKERRWWLTAGYFLSLERENRFVYKPQKLKAYFSWGERGRVRERRRRERERLRALWLQGL